MKPIGNITPVIFLNLNGSAEIWVEARDPRSFFWKKYEFIAFGAAGLLEGSHRGEYLGTFSSSLVYISGFGHWRNKLRT